MKPERYNILIILTLACLTNVCITSCDHESLNINSEQIKADLLGQWVDVNPDQQGILNHFEFTSHEEFGNFLIVHQSQNGLHLNGSSISCDWEVDPSGILTITQGKTVTAQEPCTVEKGYLMINGRKLIRDEESTYSWLPAYYPLIDPEIGGVLNSIWYCEPGSKATVTYYVDYTGHNCKATNTYGVICYDEQTKDTVQLREMEDGRLETTIQLPNVKYPDASFTMYREYEMTGRIVSNETPSPEDQKVFIQHPTINFVVGDYLFKNVK